MAERPSYDYHISGPNLFKVRLVRAHKHAHFAGYMLWQGIQVTRSKFMIDGTTCGMGEAFPKTCLFRNREPKLRQEPGTAFQPTKTIYNTCKYAIRYFEMRPTAMHTMTRDVTKHTHPQRCKCSSLGPIYSYKSSFQREHQQAPMFG
jgi:hypothetical protein